MKKMMLPALLFLCTNAFSQMQDSNTVQQYLNKNNEVIDLAGEKKINIFDAAFYSNTFFLFGENHGSSNPQLADVLLFKQLYKNAGVRFYIAEVDDTKAWMLNNFLKTGDENILKKVFKSWVSDTAQWANESNYHKFIALRQFYNTLPPNKKFTIIGIDDIQDYTLLKEYATYFKEKNKEVHLSALLDTLITITDTISAKGRKNLGLFARRMLTDMDAAKDKTAGNVSTDFYQFISTLSFTGLGIYRDSFMYKNLESTIKNFSLQKQKMYGFLGYYHCLQAGYEKSMPFAALVKKYHAGLQNKIVSIQMMAIQSKTLLPYMAQLKQMMPASYVEKLRKDNPEFPASKKYIPFELSNDNSMMKIEGIQYLKAATTANSTVIFKLDNAESPFTKGKLLAEVKGFQSIKFTDPLSNTLQAFQYILLFRDSKAGIPIE